MFRLQAGSLARVPLAAALLALVAALLFVVVPASHAQRAKGVLVVRIKTPAGVPGTVALRKKSLTRVATKGPNGTATKVRMRLPSGRWKVRPGEVLTSAGLHVAPAARVRVRPGARTRVTVRYRRAPSARDLSVTLLEPSSVGLSWSAPSADAEYAVRRSTGDEVPATASSGTAVPVAGTTATASTSPSETYTFAVFARREGTRKWWGPVSTTVTTPAADPSTGSVAAVADPGAVVVTDPGAVPVRVVDGVLRAGVPRGTTPARGQPWVLPVSAELPGGFVGRVNSISSDGLTVVLQPGGLGDAFDYFDVSAPDLSDLTFAEAPPSARTEAPRREDPTAPRLAGIGCGGSLEQSVTIDPSVDPFGRFRATLRKKKIRFAPDIPLGVTFDGSMGVDVSVTSAVSVSAGASCRIDIPALVAILPAGPVPLVYMVDPLVAAGVYGEVDVDNLGFLARLEAAYSGHLGIGEADFFEGSVGATAEPLDPTVDKASGGLELTASATATVGPGVGTSKAGAVVGVSANLTPLAATAVSAGPGCLELAAESSAAISLEAKAWLGSWDASRTVTIPDLEASNAYPGSPWHFPSGCAGDGEYRITEGTLDVSHDWSGGCENGQGACNDPGFTSTLDFQETSSAHLTVIEPGAWVGASSADPAALQAPMQFSGWTFSSSESGASTGNGCTYTRQNATQGPVEFASSPWATGLQVSPGPDLGMDARLTHYEYGDGPSSEWSSYWQFGSLGAWDTDTTNGYPRIGVLKSWQQSGSNCDSVDDQATYDQPIEYLRPGSTWDGLVPDEWRRTSRDVTSTPLEGCTPEACTWRVEGIETFDYRSTLEPGATSGHTGSGSATVEFSYVVEGR